MLKLKNSSFVFLIAFSSLFWACKEEGKRQTTAPEISSDQQYRPNFHFTPEENWMNDPNGMFYLDGIYHLFFQYYPEGNVWGPMHWGHATSKDMISWEELSIALEPDEMGYIFSGSAVVDVNNTSGFGDGTTPPVVAMFTYHDPKGEEQGRIDYQTQAIAYSLDKGKTWKKYEGNPVIDNPEIRDFRDPKMVWDDQNGQWLMVLSALDKTMFYSSQNLKDWKLISEFGQGIGAQDGVWECPDFFPIAVENSEETKWVLIQSLNPGAYNGGSGTQYFVGEFDGEKFELDPSMDDLDEKHSYWIDFGKDNYAGVTWSNIPESDNRKLFIGWMSNWLYAQEVPTETWRSAMTVARELNLEKVNDTYRVFSTPVRELDNYKTTVYQEELVQVDTRVLFGENEGVDLSGAEIKLMIPQLKEQTYEFVLYNAREDSLFFGYDHQQNQFYINRKKSGKVDFSEEFANDISLAPRISSSDSLNVQMILDKTSIEIFYDHGATVMTEIFFPNAPYTSFSVRSKEAFNLENVVINQINSKSENDGKPN